MVKRLVQIEKDDKFQLSQQKTSNKSTEKKAKKTQKKKKQEKIQRLPPKKRYQYRAPKKKTPKKQINNTNRDSTTLLPCSYSNCSIPEGRHRHRCIRCGATVCSLCCSANPKIIDRQDLEGRHICEHWPDCNSNEASV